MALGRSSNPVFNQDRFRNIANSATSDGVMTVNGTITKTLILFVILIAAGAFVWGKVTPENLLTFVIGGAIGGLIFALATIFKPAWAPITAALYAVFEGMFVGAISKMYASFYDGIVMQAVGLTMSILLVMLVLYRTGVLRATPKFRRGVIIATAGIFLFYILNWIFSMFGGGVSLANFGLLGIGIQLVIVGVASLNLILDFDNIERGAEQGLPKIMEWYSGFGIMVTLVWLYLELLRLIALISGRN